MFDFFDCHCDTVTTAMSKCQNLFENNLHIDFKRLSAFGTVCQFFGIWLNDEQLKNAFNNTDKAIDFLEEQIDKNTVKKVTAAGEIEKGGINAFFSIEGGEAIENSIDNISHFYGRGVRLMTLTWNNVNNIGSGAMSGSDDGLTDFGINTVREMNRIGMIADVSHINKKGFYDVCRIAEAPFMASHSNAYALCPHIRNLDDDQIKQISCLGGIIGVNLYPPFVCEGGICTADDIIRHIDYLLNMAGEHSVALGCDFDGIDVTPRDIRGIEDMPVLYDRTEREFGKKTANDIFFNNVYDFMTKNI